MRQGFLRLLFALLVLCSPAAAQTQISTNIADDGELKVVYADFPASEAESGGSIHAAIITLQVVNQYQCVPNPGNPPVGSIRVYCDSGTGNLTCLNSSGGNCFGGGGGSGFVFGTGTPPDLPIWVNSTTLGNSAWTDTLTTTTYNGTGGVATKAVTYTGVPPFAETAIEGPSSDCLPIAAGQDALCSIADLSPAGLWYSADGAPYVPLAPQGSSNGPIFNDQLISGGGVTWTGLLNFTVGAASYAIVSTNYTSPQTNVTLAPADATNPRIDSIVVDNTGTVVVLTGTPAGSPAAPVPDPTTQLQLTTVTVAANATTPTLNSILVYDENIGTPTEWNCTPSAHFSCNSTNNPFHLTHDIEATTAVAGNNAVLAYSSTVNLATYSTISFNIRNKATWPAAKSVSICFLNSATIVGQCIGFKNGIFGFNQANVSSYQQIVIPLSAFALTGIVDRVRFQVAGGGASIGFYLDWIQIQSSLTGGGSGGNFQLQVNGTATALAANLVDNASVTWAQSTVNGQTTVQATAVGAPPSGTAGGALAGTYPNPTLANATACTNQFVTAISQSTAAGTCTTDTLASAQHANQGTTTTVLHGNAAGNPSFGAVSNSDLTNASTTVNGQTCTLGSTCSSISGLTSTQVPIAGSATTLTSSKALQGTDTSILTSGTVSGTGVSLCTDANGGATTSGCSGGGVTSVGLALPSNLMTVSGSPVTSSGTLTGTLTAQNVGTVFAGPATLPGTNATLVQTCTGFNNTTGVNEVATATCGSPVTAGDQLILWAFTHTTSGGGVSSFTFTDGPSDTFVSDVSFSNYDSRVSHVISAIGGNTTFTATPSNGNSNNVTIIYVMEYKGITGFDAAGTTTQNGNPSTSSTVTTVGTNDLVVTFGFSFSTGQSNGNSAFTVEQTLNTPTLNANFYSMAADRGAAAAGAYVGTINSTGTNFNQVITVGYTTSGTPTATPSFRKLVASDLPIISNYLWTSDLTAQTSAVSDTTIFTVGSANADFLFHGNINCTTSSAAATATLNLKWTDTSNTAQTLSALATCTTLGTSSLNDMVHQIRGLAGTAIKYGVTIANTPTFDVGVRLNAQ